MPALYRYRIFVSHAWRYNADYDRLISMLDGAPNFMYANYSVPKDDAFDRSSKAVLQDKLRDQIRWVDVSIILAGMYAAHSDWIQFEIDVSKAMNKPILGIRPWGAERIPDAVSSAAKRMVYWQTSSIVDAIRQLA